MALWFAGLLKARAISANQLTTAVKLSFVPVSDHDDGLINLNALGLRLNRLTLLLVY